MTKFNLISALLISIMGITSLLGQGNTARIDYGLGWDLSKPDLLLPARGGNIYPLTELGTIFPTGMEYSRDGTKLFVISRTPAPLSTTQVTVTTFDLTQPYTYPNIWNSLRQVEGEDRIPLLPNNHRFTGLAFSNTGTKLFTIDEVDNELRQYSLIVPWTPSAGMIVTATYPTSGTKVNFSRNGLKMYISSSGGRIFQFTLTNAFDITNVSYDGLFEANLPPQESISDFEFDKNGTRLQISTSSGFLYLYELNTWFDVTGTVTEAGSHNFLGIVSNFQKTMSTPNGSKMTVFGSLGSSNYVIMDLEMNTEGFKELEANDGRVEGKMTITCTNTRFRPNTTLVYGVDYVFGYLPPGLIPNLTTNGFGDIATLTFSGQALNNDAEDGIELVISMLTPAFVVPPSTLPVTNRLNVSTGVDIVFRRNSSIYYGNGFSLAAGLEETSNVLPSITHPQDPTKVEISPDGRHVYIWNHISLFQSVHHYELSTPFDLTTGTYISSWNDSRNRQIYDLKIEANGRRLFISANLDDLGITRITQFNLSIPYDLNSASRIEVADPNDPSDPPISRGSPRFFDFSYDGMKVITEMAGVNGRFATEITLRKPYDLYGYKYSDVGDLYSEFDFKDFSNNTRHAYGAFYTPKGDHVLVYGEGDDITVPGNLLIPAIRKYVTNPPFTTLPDQSVTSVEQYNEGVFPRVFGMAPDRNGTEFYALNPLGTGTLKALKIVDPTPFVETGANNGVITGQQRIYIVGGALFRTPGAVLSYGSDYTIPNLPAGLTPVLTVNAAGDSAILTLTGAATNHASTDSVDNLIFDFSSSAYSGTVRDIDINFSQFTESRISIRFLPEPPVAVCQNITVELDASGTVTISADDVDGGSIADGGIASKTINIDTFDCFNIGANSVVLTITNNSGVSSNCTAIVTVEDNIAPVAVCQDITVELDANGSVTVIATEIDGGSIDNCFIAGLGITQGTFTCADVGPNTVTLTVTDSAGNSATCTAVITVEDNIPPTLNCAPDAFRDTDPGVCTYSIVGTEFDAIFSDDCGNATITNDFNNTATLVGETLPLGETEIIWRVDDGNGNLEECNTFITVEDNEAPTVTCNFTTINAQTDPGQCTRTIVATSFDPTVSDNCAILSVANDFNGNDTLVGAALPLGQTIVTWTVEDENGNTNTCSITFFVNDPEDPQITCPANDTRNTDAGQCSYSVVGTEFDATFTDNCTNGSITNNLNGTDTLAGAILSVGDNTITWTADDGNGNSVSCTTTITVQDNEAPMAVCQNITVQLDASGNVSITANDVDGGSSDACGIASTSIDVSTFDCSNVGANNVVLTVTDVNGNSSQCTTVVTVEDTVVPLALCQNITVQLDASGQASITANDVDGGSNDACGIASTSIDVSSFDCSNVGTNNVTLTVTDVNGNSSQCSAVVTVEDTVVPNAVCQNITVQLDASGNASIVASDVDGGSTDACGIATTSIDVANFNCNNLGPNNVTLTVTDVNGNSSTCVAIVTVIDDIAPVIACPAAISVSTDFGACSAVVTFTDALALDNCSVSVAQTAGLSSGSAFPVGVSTVEFTATDAGGNTSVCSFTITVTDTAPPTTLCQNITVQLDASGNATITAADVDGGSFDNCSLDTLAIDIDTFDCSNVGPNNVTLTATDIYGNSSSCVAVVTVEDATAPVAVCQNITVQLDASGSVTIDPALLDGGSTDACGIDASAYSVDIDTFDCSNIGDNPVTLTVTDVNGNSSTCSAIVTVEDVTAPEIVCQDITIELDENGEATIVPEDVIASNTDACGSTTTSVDISSFSCDDIGSPVLVTVFSEDSFGNISSCTALVTVEDVLGPVFDSGTLPVDVVRQADENGEYMLEDFTVDVTVSDNCSEPLLPIVIGQDPAIGTILTPGIYDITLSAIDDLGNVTNYVFLLTVEEFLGTGDLAIDLSTVVLYPNPTKALVNISNPQQIALKQLAIYDLTGRLVKSFNLSKMGSETSLDVSTLASASYLVVIEGEGILLTKQLVKE
ncbi:MAG: HYR domain-containing protein [Flavobacteriaceae bacterium]